MPTFYALFSGLLLFVNMESMLWTTRRLSVSSGPQPVWHCGAVSWKTIFHGPGWEGWFRDDSSTLHLLCTLFLLLLYQLHLRSSDFKSWRCRAPGLLEDFSLLYKFPAMFRSHTPGFNSLVDGGRVKFLTIVGLGTGRMC